MRGKIGFVTIGLDGPRNITNKIRGDYDKIFKGIDILKKYDIPFALCGVILSSTKDGVVFACQSADALGAKKFKLILPIPKGNALNLPESEYMSNDDADGLFDELISMKHELGWKVKITMTTWTQEVEGYSILAYPNGNTYTWPVYDQKDKVLYLGNLLEDKINEIWERYPYRQNHINKYLGRNIHII